MELSLKRGSGLVFDGENWQTVSEKRWHWQPIYVPSQREVFVGRRQLAGQEFAVFRCLDDEFLAQPVNICELPIPEDPVEVVFEHEPEEEPMAPNEKKSSKSVQIDSKSLQFEGKNWKLAADKKWKPINGFVPQLGEKVGNKTIGKIPYTVHKGPLGFIAIREEEAEGFEPSTV
jgi:hypothetical protein